MLNRHRSYWQKRPQDLAFVGKFDELSHRRFEAKVELLHFQFDSRQVEKLDEW